MRSGMSPGFAIGASAVLRQAVDVVGAGHYCEHNACCNNDVANTSLHDEQRKEVFVPSKSGPGNLDATVKYADQSHCAQADPFHDRGGRAREEESEPAETDEDDEDDDRFLKGEILRHGLANYCHCESPIS